MIQALEGSYQNVDPHSNPLATLTALKFDGSSGWLFGAKFSALETVTLSAVFNDPVLYGLRLALDGKRVGKLAGLEFEILYRKVSDNLGVFHIELKLPDAMRKIQAGEANITLPIIDLDIYTNGDFLLDLGFPVGLDFSRSFQIDIIVWVGPIPIPVSAAAGLYFGVLSGATSSQVPQVTNGSFAPVIVAGFGIEDRARLVGVDRPARRGLLRRVHRDPRGRPGVVPPGLRPGFDGGLLQGHRHGRDPDPHLGHGQLRDPPGQPGRQRLRDRHRGHRELPADRGRLRGGDLDLGVGEGPVLLHYALVQCDDQRVVHDRPGRTDPVGDRRGAVGSSQQRGSAARHRRSTWRSRAGERGVRARAEQRDQLARPARPPRAQSGLTLGVYLQPMLTAGLAGDHPGGTMQPQPQAQLVATLFVADRGQLEGALAVANADLPLRTGLPLSGPDSTAHQARRHRRWQTQPGDTFGKLAWTSARPPRRLLPRLRDPYGGRAAAEGTAIALPDGTVTLDGGGYTVPTDTETLSSIAAQLLSPFEQLTREALLWAVESAQLERAAGAGGARRPGDRAGRARAGHAGVGQPPARALRRPDQPRRAVPAVPGGRLPRQPGHHRRSAPHADHRHRTGQSVVHDVPDAAVPAADRRRHQPSTSGPAPTRRLRPTSSTSPATSRSSPPRRPAARPPGERPRRRR